MFTRTLLKLILTQNSLPTALGLRTFALHIEFSGFSFREMTRKNPANKLSSELNLKNLGTKFSI